MQTCSPRAQSPHIRETMMISRGTDFSADERHSTMSCGLWCFFLLGNRKWRGIPGHVTSRLKCGPGASKSTTNSHPPCRMSLLPRRSGSCARLPMEPTVATRLGPQTRTVHFATTSIHTRHRCGTMATVSPRLRRPTSATRYAQTASCRRRSLPKRSTATGSRSLTPGTTTLRNSHNTVSLARH
jgi:hypothetical protein